MKNIVKKLRFIVLSASLLTMVKIQSSGIVPAIAAKAASAAGLGQISSSASQLAINAQTALSAITDAKATTSAAVTLAGSQIHHPFVGSMPAIVSTKAFAAVTAASLAGTALPVGICVAYAGTIAHAAHQAKQGQIKLTHTPENIYELAALHDEVPMLSEGNGNGGNSDNGNGKTSDHNSWYNNTWYKNTKFKIAAPSLGASIVAGMMKYFNQPEEEKSNSVEQLLDYLYEPTSKKFGKDADKYWHRKQNNTEFNDGTFSLSRISGKGDQSAIARASYDYNDRTNRSEKPDWFEFFVWHNTCDQEMYDKLQARQKGKRVDLELPLQAFCDISEQAGKKENHVPNIEKHRRSDYEEENFTVDAGKFGTYICRPGHLGLSNLVCYNTKEWDYMIERVKKSEAIEKEMNEESIKSQEAKK